MFDTHGPEESALITTKGNTADLSRRLSLAAEEVSAESSGRLLYHGKSTAREGSAVGKGDKQQR